MPFHRVRLFQVQSLCCWFSGINQHIPQMQHCFKQWNETSNTYEVFFDPHCLCKSQVGLTKNVQHKISRLSHKIADSVSKPRSHEDTIQGGEILGMGQMVSAQNPHGTNGATILKIGGTNCANFCSMKKNDQDRPLTIEEVRILVAFASLQQINSAEFKHYQSVQGPVHQKMLHVQLKVAKSAICKVRGTFHCVNKLVLKSMGKLMGWELCHK